MFRVALAILILSAPLFAAVTGRTALERFDVRAFGAVGDEVVDDQPAINKAVGALAQHKSGILFFRTVFIVAPGRTGCRTPLNSPAFRM